MNKKENITNAILRSVNNNPKLKANIIIGQLAFRYSESQDTVNTILSSLIEADLIEIVKEEGDVFIKSKEPSKD